MKLFYSLTALIFSFSALACPNLAGTYSCTDSDDTTGQSYQTTMTQVTQNGVTVYSSTDDNFDLIVDGQERPMNVEGGFVAMAKFACADDSRIDGQFYLDTEAGKIVGEVVIEKLSNDMSSNSTMYLNGNIVGTSQTLCTRI